MTIQQASQRRGSSTTGTTRLHLVIAGALFLFGAAAGAGTVQLAHSGTSTKPVHTASQPLPVAVVRPATSTHAVAGPIVYLTASQAAQSVAETDLEAAATVRRLNGDATQLPSAAAVTSSAAELQLRRAIADENQLRVGLGLAEISIVDLRTAVVPATSVGRPTGHVAAAPVTYLVADEQQATFVRAALSDAEEKRLALGGKADIGTITVVSSTTDETQLKQTIADENSLRASLNLPEISIVDLR